MEIIRDIRQCHIQNKTAVTVGKFDGIHKGHDLLTKKIVAMKKEGYQAVVVTFTVSPRVAVKNEENKNLITAREREHILENEGIDYLVECTFDDEMLHMEAADFILLLIEKLHMRYMVSGMDFHFGYQGRGDIQLLQKMASRYGFSFESIVKIKSHKRDISSSYIREEIQQGNIETADDLLGYPYFIWGEIVHGNHIGTKMGVPTINMIPPKDKLLPPHGVYVTQVEIEHRQFHGVTNIGIKPTVQDSQEVNVETFILDFQEDVYEKYARVSFYKMLRPERKFASLEELKEQIGKDTHAALQFFNKDRR